MEKMLNFIAELEHHTVINMNLPLNNCATDVAEFWKRYQSFCVDKSRSERTAWSRSGSFSSSTSHWRSQFEIQMSANGSSLFSIELFILLIYSRWKRSRQQSSTTRTLVFWENLAWYGYYSRVNFSRETCAFLTTTPYWKLFALRCRLLTKAFLSFFSIPRWALPDFYYNSYVVCYVPQASEQCRKPACLFDFCKI